MRTTLIESADKSEALCLVLPCFNDSKLGPQGQAFEELSQNFISQHTQDTAFEGQVGQTRLFYNVPSLGNRHLLLFGCGTANKLDRRQFTKAIESAMAVIKREGLRHIALGLQDAPLLAPDLPWQARQVLQACAKISYRFEQFKSEKSKLDHLEHVELIAEKPMHAILEPVIEQTLSLNEGVALTKDLANLPSNICNPSYLAEQAQQLAADYDALSTTIIDEQDMEKMGMGAFVSVSKGSSEPGKLIIMNYQGGDVDEKPLVFVGKGITFDSGGISLKPPAAMDEMKYDMGGAASVFGLMKALAHMKLNANVIGMVASAENMPSGHASKPGDIVKSLSGQTIEILNTDAEGRLVLCDTLTYAQQQFKPEIIVDIATLTGAMVVALGHHATGLLGNCQQLCDELLEAGLDSNDRAWQMPLWEEYKDGLKSPFADMANVGERWGGGITAASFLSNFTKEVRWAHLDIAGSAWQSGANKGSTGRCVPLLVQFVLNRVNAKS